MSFTGPARVFDQEEQMLKALEGGESSHRHGTRILISDRSVSPGQIPSLSREVLSSFDTKDRRGVLACRRC